MFSKKLLLSISLIAIVFVDSTYSQPADSTERATIQLSGYVDAYYAFYTDSLGDADYQKFPSVSPRSNQFGLNSALITAQYDAEKIRGIVTLHFGDIPRCSWSGTFNNIMEAHAGVRLCKTLWLDAGFFRTHFGTEGLLPKENIASSISVPTFYEPYFESGVRLNYNPNDKLAINIYGLNGYNLYEDNNKKKSLAMLITYALKDKGNIGYSNYIGDDTPSGDSISHIRFHNNLFFNYQVKKLKMQIGVDYCAQQNSNSHEPDKAATMYSALAALKYQATTPFAIYARGEYINDTEGFMTGIIVDTENRHTGVILWGATLGVEYKPTENSYVRLEGRQLQADEAQEIFYWDGENTSSRMEFAVNLGISF
ncbi:MAG: outer membrane beta-barrel protein [Chitinophagales bacterium]